MRILGLDLSLTSTGYVLLDSLDDPSLREVVLWSGSVDGSKLREVERLAMFDKWIREALLPMAALITPGLVVTTSRPPIDYIAIEGYSFGSPAGQTRAFGLGELGGVIKLAIHQAGIPVHIIPSGTWKKVLCGNGGLKKDQVRLELFKRYGIEFPSQDTLDAWAVAMCLRRQLLGLDKPEPKVRSRKAPADVPLVEAMA